MSTKAPAWSRAFDDPVPVSGGRGLRTLHDDREFSNEYPSSTYLVVWLRKSECDHARHGVAMPW